MKDTNLAYSDLLVNKVDVNLDMLGATVVVGSHVYRADVVTVAIGAWSS